MGSNTVVLEERPYQPTPKREKIAKEKIPQIEEYSHTQSPLSIGDEQLTKEQVE